MRLLAFLVAERPLRLDRNTAQPALRCVLALIAAVGLLWLAAGCKQRVQVSKHNVLLIVADSLRWDMLGCYGGDARTRNIDWLAQNGVAFTRAYSVGIQTQPAAVGLFTGDHPGVYSVDPGRPGARPTLHLGRGQGSLLQRLRGSRMQLDALAETPLARLGGGGAPLRQHSPAMTLPGPRKARVLANFTDESSANRVRELGRLRPSFLHALDLLGQQQPTRAFLFSYWMTSPHSGINPMVMAALDSDQLKAAAWPHRRLGPRDGSLFTAAETAYRRRLYRAEVENLDARVGALLTVLQGRGLLKTTLIVFTAGRGVLLGEHGKWGRGGDTCYDELIRVPLIIAGPGVKLRGVEASNLVSTADLLPTLADIARVRRRGVVTHGESFAGLLGSLSARQRTVFSGARGGLLDTAVKGRYLLQGDPVGGHHRLYDLVADASQIHDVAWVFPSVVKTMLAELNQANKEARRRQQINLKRLPRGLDRGRYRKTLRALGYVE